MTLHIRAHCVGVTQQHLIFEAKGQPLRFYRILWDSQSCMLTSPFYTHSLELSQDGEQYKIIKWQKTEYRLSHYTPSRAKDMIKSTFFLFLTGERANLPKTYFPFELLRKGLCTTYASSFSLDKALALSEGKSASVFWPEFRRRHKTELKKVCEKLALSEKAEELSLSLDHWWSKSFIALYHMNHLNDMSHLFYVNEHNTLLQLPLASLSRIRLRDMTLLHQTMAAIATSQTLPPVIYTDFAGLLQVTLKQKMPQLLEHHFATIKSAEKRATLFRTIFVPQFISHIEYWAAKDVSTCYPVNLRSILSFFTRLFGLKLDEEVNLGEVIECESCVSFTGEHYAEFVLRLQEGLDNSSLVWHALKPEKSLTKLSQRLFLVENQPDELATEKQLEALFRDSPDWTKEIRSHEASLMSDFDLEAWHSAYDEMDELTRSLYTTRVQLIDFYPREVCQKKDLDVMRRILMDDFFSTTIILPPRATFTRKRFILYFTEYTNDMPLLDLKSRVFDFSEKRPVNMSDIVVVLDAHLYSNHDMLELFKWLHAGRKELSRLVIMGIHDVLPLHCCGHAFLNLLEWHNPVFTAKRLYQFTTLIDEFAHFVQHSRARIHAVTLLSQLQEAVEQVCRDAVTIRLHLIGRQTTTDAEENVREQFTLKFARARHLTVQSLQTSGLFFEKIADPQTSHIHAISYTALISMGRNEWHHILLAVDHLFVYDVRDAKLEEALVKKASKATFPNSRYTLPFYSTVIHS